MLGLSRVCRCTGRVSSKPRLLYSVSIFIYSVDILLISLIVTDFHWFKVASLQKLISTARFFPPFGVFTDSTLSSTDRFVFVWVYTPVIQDGWCPVSLWWTFYIFYIRYMVEWMFCCGVGHKTETNNPLLQPGTSLDDW